MALPTQPVTCRFYDQAGNPVAFAEGSFHLDRRELFDGVIAPEKVDFKADADGVVVLSMFPNELGTQGSQYRVRAINPDTGSKFLDAMCVVPDSPSNLHEILLLQPFPTVDAAEQAVIIVQGALAAVTAQVGFASNFANSAGESAQASGDALEATVQQAGFAEDSAADANASAGRAEAAASAFTHRGTWAPATLYTKNNVVVVSSGLHRGCSFSALSTHVSSGGFEADLVTKWGLVAEKGDQGDPGPANVLTVGSVTTGEPGTAASAVVTGISPNQTLDLTIPRGQPGANGTGFGDMIAANNLSELTDPAVARTNLGLNLVNNTPDASKPIST
ncbi:MAG: hypothetical protein EON92_20615, partial [Burkholderiales bacterium]